MTPENNQPEVKQSLPEILEYPKEHYEKMKSWYNQQIQLKKLNLELSKLNASIAEEKFREVLAHVKIANVSAPDPEPGEEDPKTTQKQKQEAPVAETSTE